MINFYYRSSNPVMLFTVDKEGWDVGASDYTINFSFLNMCKFDACKFQWTIERETRIYFQTIYIAI
jgi:hypothetical protein